MQTLLACPRVLLGGFAFVCVSAFSLYPAPASAATCVVMTTETEKEAFNAAMVAVKAVAALDQKVSIAEREVERCQRESATAQQAADAALVAYAVALRDHATDSVLEAAARAAKSAQDSWGLAEDRVTRAVSRYRELTLEYVSAKDAMKIAIDAWTAKTKKEWPG